jgi:PilZ domain
MRFEHRRALRVPVDLPARYRSGNLSLDGRARDLSQFGLFFVGDATDADGGDVFVEVDLPDDPTHPLALKGEVSRVEGDGMGIRFLGLDVSDRRRLANYLIYRSHRASG